MRVLGLIIISNDDGSCNIISQNINVGCIIVDLIVIFVTLGLLYKGLMFVFQNIDVIPKDIYTVYVITCITWVLSFGIALIQFVGSLSVNYICTSITSVYMLNTSKWMYYISISNEYLFYVQRLKLVFTNTNQVLSQIQFKLFRILYLFQIFCAVLWMILITINPIFHWIGILILIIYLTSSIMVLVLFVYKSIKLRNNIRLKMAVKYIICVFVTLITISVISIMESIHYNIATQQKDDQILKAVIYIYTLISILDGFLHVVLLHCQLRFLFKCYYILCNPFRFELNNIFNKIIPGINLTIYDNSKDFNDNKPTLSDEIPDYTIEMVSVSPRYIIPTKSESNNNTFDPYSTSDEMKENSDNIDERKCLFFYCFSCNYTF